MGVPQPAWGLTQDLGGQKHPRPYPNLAVHHCPGHRNAARKMLRDPLGTPSTPGRDRGSTEMRLALARDPEPCLAAELHLLEPGPWFGQAGAGCAPPPPAPEEQPKPRPRDSHYHSLGDRAVLRHKRSAAEILLASAGVCAGTQPGSRHPGRQQMSAPDRCPVRASRALWPRLGEQGRDEGLFLEGTRDQGGPKDARMGFISGFHPWVPGLSLPSPGVPPSRH